MEKIQTDLLNILLLFLINYLNTKAKLQVSTRKFQLRSFQLKCLTSDDKKTIDTPMLRSEHNCLTPPSSNLVNGKKNQFSIVMLGVDRS